MCLPFQNTINLYFFHFELRSDPDFFSRLSRFRNFFWILIPDSNLGEEDCGRVHHAEGPGRDQVGSGLRRGRRLCLRPQTQVS